jgi:predicted metalloendopeptidase
MGGVMRIRFVAQILAIAGVLAAQNASHSGIHPEDMDSTCKPCTDFWRFVNGGWVDKNPIPSHLLSWGPFEVLAEVNNSRIRSILEDAAANPAG